jgi:hypothetical protein
MTTTLKPREWIRIGSALVMLGTVAALGVGCDDSTDSTDFSSIDIGNSGDPSSDPGSSDPTNSDPGTSDSPDPTIDFPDTTSNSPVPGPDCYCACTIPSASGGCADVCTADLGGGPADFCNGAAASPLCASCLSRCAGIISSDAGQCS